MFTYSFPCQDISLAGKQRGLQEGSGTRSSLLWECLRAIEKKKPKFLLMENVANLASKKFLPFFLQWQQTISSMGYSNFSKILDARNYGIPQHRQRLFMVSVLNTDKTFYWPEPISLRFKIKDILELNVSNDYYLNDEKIRTLQYGNYDNDRLLIPLATKQGYVEIPIGAVFDGSFPNSKTRRGRLQNQGETAPTLTANGEPLNYFERHIDNRFVIRKLTEKEYFLLMGLEESNIKKIQDCGLSRKQQYKLAGNSIVVDVLVHIFKNLLFNQSFSKNQLCLF